MSTEVKIFTQTAKTRTFGDKLLKAPEHQNIHAIPKMHRGYGHSPTPTPCGQ